MAGLTDRQQRFIDEYLVSLNATRAAVRAGYSVKTAKQMGAENLTKPQIRSVIDAELKDLSLSAGETTKLISDIAKASLNDYFIIKEVVQTPKVKRHLSEVIKDIEAEMEDADKFIVRAKVKDQEALGNHNAQQERKGLEIIRLQIELERNPNAFRIVPGPSEFVKVAELDLARLVQDKEAGRIKSVKPTEFGTTVEMYAADSALRDVARMHGLFEKDNDQSKPVITNLQTTVYSTKKHAPPVVPDGENK